MASSSLKENVFPNKIVVRNVILNNIIVTHDGVDGLFSQLLRLAYGIANYVDCSVKSYYVCDWCFVTDSQGCVAYIIYCSS